MEQVNTKTSDRVFQEYTASTTLYSTRSIVGAAVFTVCYLFLAQLLLGFHADQVVLVVLFNTLFFTNRATRQWIMSFSIFLLYWIIFDFMKAFPNYHFGTVHIESLYHLEKQLFGIDTGSEVITPNEFFLVNRTTFLDFITGLFYLCWIPVPLAFAVVIYFKSKNYFFQFAFTFLLVNFIGFIGYYLVPSAPPWYVHEYGFAFNPQTPGHTAGLQHFDQLTGLNIFQALYAKSSNVFAAMPSLHAAYMLLVTIYSIRMGQRYWSVIFAVITAGIWFSAVYTSHHYVLDIIAGILTAITGYLLFQYAIRTSTGSRIFGSLLSACKY